VRSAETGAGRRLAQRQQVVRQGGLGAGLTEGPSIGPGTSLGAAEEAVSRSARDLPSQGFGPHLFVDVVRFVN
jgi:hypothetical protein